VTASVDPTDASRVIVIKDVSDRTELLRRIREATTDAETARAAFARSAEVIGEFLYSGELLRDEQLLITATGPGLPALLGADDDDGAALASYDEYVHPEDWPAYHEEWRFGRLRERDGEVVEHDYRLVGDDGVARWVRDRWRVIVQDGRVFVTGAVRDISSQRRAEEDRATLLRQLEHLSSVDSLTELYNRRHLDEKLEERLARPDSRIAIAMIDVDHFKRINDEYGHGGGDDVLRTVARRLRQTTRPHDIVARWGGEEFCVLLADVADDEHLQALAERLRLAICSDPITVGGGAQIAVAVSVGAARSTDVRADDVLALADAALYRAKETGRNRVIIGGTRALTEVTDEQAQPLATACDGSGWIRPHVGSTGG
jgi:diguanylate cyclase (GGDEF)-like protein/PAS domain S-box-containing protein